MSIDRQFITGRVLLTPALCRLIRYPHSLFNAHLTLLRLFSRIFGAFEERASKYSVYRQLKAATDKTLRAYRLHFEPQFATRRMVEALFMAQFCDDLGINNICY